jgi:predicted secreted hydrolase
MVRGSDIDVRHPALSDRGMIRKAKAIGQACSITCVLAIALSAGVAGVFAAESADALALAAAPATGRAPSSAGRLGLIMGGDTQGYARADKHHKFSFPRDHGPHPAFRIEWWYLTGHLRSDVGEQFGVQLTFFRFALRPQSAASESDASLLGTPSTSPLSSAHGGPPQRSLWRGRYAWMAHLALTDETGGRFYSEERFSRDALGLSGASEDPPGVWLEDWQFRASDREATGFVATAGGREFSLSLSMLSGKPPVLNGDRGLSQKGTQPGNASYYYSLTRMPASGTVTTSRGQHTVAGHLWLDREWSTSALEADVAGWDWFALQLDDGRELMYYQLRRRDGSSAPQSAGTLVQEDGTSKALDRQSVQIDVLQYWESSNASDQRVADAARNVDISRDSASVRRYPSKWRIRSKALGEPVVLVPILPDQEHVGLIHYWEGAVEVRRVGGQLLGRGYVEMTGY